MNLRINDLQWQRCRQRRRPTRIFAAYSDLEPLSTVSNPESQATLAAINLTEKHERLFAVLNQIGRVCPAKRLSAPQIRQRLQKTCLAGGVSTTDQIEARAQFNLHLLKATKVAGPKKANHRLSLFTKGA
jgi:hypothetical protein